MTAPGAATPRDGAAPPPADVPALALADLRIGYRTRGQLQEIVRGVSLTVGRGESLGLVGESGCGKSTIALGVVRYLARNGRITGGSIAVDGRDVLAMGSEELRALRARSVSMVYQEPGRALNPTLTVGRQVAEVYELAGLARREALQRAEAMLGQVRISAPAVVMDRYPHQLSGGMLQRVVIAMALAAQPSLLILDEPTTALDATVEAEVLELIGGLRAELGISLLFISHNLGVIAQMCDRVGVLYAGELVEEGPAGEVLRDARHPYSVGLLRSIPRRETSAGATRPVLATIPGSLPAPGETVAGCIFADRCGLADDRCRTEPPPMYPLGADRGSRCHHHERAQSLPIPQAPPAPAGQTGAGNGTAPEPLVRVRAASKTFRSGRETVHALRDVDLDVAVGETVGLVGESGSGKTTLARIVMGLTAADDGAEVTLRGRPLAPLAGRRSTEDLKTLQIVFQNPDSALNRRHSVRGLIERSLTRLGGYRGEQLAARLATLVESVRLPERYLPMRPSQLSGGLKQRVAIARAFAGDPLLVVCDEPTSALDVSVQAAILNLLTELQRRERVAYLFISHDLGVIRYLADRIVVLYLGRVMESGPADIVFAGPQHPYTEALLSSVPSLDGGSDTRIRLDGEIPSSAHPPSGCPFQTRCPRKLGEICETTEPPLTVTSDGHAIRCHISSDELGVLQRAGSPGRTNPDS